MHELPTPTMVNTSTPKPRAQKFLMVPISLLGVHGYPQVIMCNIST